LRIRSSARCGFDPESRPTIDIATSANGKSDTNETRVNALAA